MFRLQILIDVSNEDLRFLLIQHFGHYVPRDQHNFMTTKVVNLSLKDLITERTWIASHNVIQRKI